MKMASNHNFLYSSEKYAQARTGHGRLTLLYTGISSAAAASQPLTPPSTGDDSSLLVWLCALIASAGVLLVLSWHRHTIE